MKLRLLMFLILLSIGLGIQTHAAGLIVVTDLSNPDQPVTAPPGRWFRMPGRVLEMVSHQVEVTIDDQFAETKIRQGFHNPTGRRLEGTFLFPVPRGAQLKSFTMEINGKAVEAELLAADKARKIYEDIVRRQRDPALLEFVERDLYKVRIFPIEPNETKQLVFSYEQLLKSEAGLVSFNYPMSVEKFSSKPIDKVSLNISLKTGKPLKTIYSPTHEVEIIRDGNHRARIGYETSGDTAEQDFELFFSREDEGFGMSLLSYRPDESEDGYFLLLASPGVVEEPDEVLPKDVVFVIDTSGSMAGGKLDQAKKALTFCVDNLNAADRFEMVQFATDVQPLFNGVELADPAHRDIAKKSIERLKPRGGTAIDSALKAAVDVPQFADRSGKTNSDTRPLIIVFLTDGLPTVGETNIDKIVANVIGTKRANKRIFCFGIGNDVNTHLLDRITEETRGASQYVLPGENLEVKVSSFFAKIKDPVLIQPELRFPRDAGARLMYPSPLPDLFSGEQLVLVGRYTGKASGAVELTGKSGETERRYAEDVSFEAVETDNEFIARLWATRRIGWLINEIRLRGESKELKEEVTELAREHGIVTPYTAWLIVEDEQRRGVRPDLQTLRQTRANRDALRYSQNAVQNLNKEQSGADATLSAQYGARARSATVAPSPAASPESRQYDNAFLSRYGERGGGGGGSSSRILISRSLDLSRQQSEASANTSEVGQVLPSELARQSHVVAGKSFYENGEEWIDAEIQKHPDANRVKITFGSTEYFDLLRKDSRFAQWASVGTKLQFYFAGTIYQIE